jgi:hypothetical protein
LGKGIFSHWTNRKYEAAAVVRDQRMFINHRFIPRIFKRATIKRKAINGYPRELKNRVAKAIIPRKRRTGVIDPGITSTGDFFVSASFSLRRKRFRRKRPDRIMRMIPSRRGNKPVPAARKVPMGIRRERKIVSPPNKKRMTPPMPSSLFNLSPPIQKFQIYIWTFKFGLHLNFAI